MQWKDVARPRKGDLASHVSGELDSREVTRVEGEQVWLWILVSEAGPFPVENYTYKRKSE